MGYGIAAMVALIVVLVGVVTMRNQSALDQVKEQLNTLQTMNQNTRPANQDRTLVETQKAQITPVQVTASPTATAIPSVSSQPSSVATAVPSGSES